MKKKTLAKTLRSRSLEGAGLLLILLTFVVKEGLRDHLKDIQTSIAGAKNAMGEQSRAFAADSERLAERMKSEQLSTKLSQPPAIGLVSRIELSQEVTDCLGAEAQSAAMLQSISTLIDKLPANETVTLQRVLEVDKTEETELKRTLEASARTSYQIQNPTWKDQALALVPLFNVLAYDLKLVALEDAVTSMTKQVEEKNVALYNRYTFTFYALYAAGWVLTAIGFLRGDKTQKVE